MLACVVERIEQHLRLVLVGRDVVGDLHRPQLATLVALADAEAARDVGMRVRDRSRDRGDLRVAVIALISLGELGPGKSGRRGEDQDGERGRDDRHEAGSAGGPRHAPMMPALSSPRDAGMGPGDDGRNVPAALGHRRYRSNHSMIRWLRSIRRSGRPAAANTWYSSG